MSTIGLATRLRRLADLAEVRGTPGEASQWRRLFAIVEDAGIEHEAALGQIVRIPPLSLEPGIQQRAAQLIRHGADFTLLKASESLPWLLRRLLDGGEFDSFVIAVLARQGIVTPGELASGLQNGQVRQHLAAQEEALRMAAEALTPDRPLVPLGRAADILESLIARLGEACPELTQLTAAGDVRRFEPLVEWFAIAASASAPIDAVETVCALAEVQPVLHRTPPRVILTYRQVEVDVRIAAPVEFGSVLHAATGSQAHIASVRACRRHTPPAAREEDEYQQAGLAWIAPELRHDTGEIEAARSGLLPALVEREDIAGDLHMHTDYSDGRDDLTTMVQAAAALGYAYIAITDHSARSFASRTLSLDTLARQRDEIARLREEFPTLTILHGVEVDIMPDGQLDFSDHVLATLDIVLASLHDRAGHDEARLTRRCLAAIHHPLVNIVTHPANRVVGRDDGYELDFDAVFEAAASTGTALEVDGAPGHLDMDSGLARRAVAAGVTVAIDSDCHRASLLDRQMRLGVGTARRGWVEARHVLNTRPLEAVQGFLVRKRHGW